MRCRTCYISAKRFRLDLSNATLSFLSSPAHKRNISSPNVLDGALERNNYFSLICEQRFKKLIVFTRSGFKHNPPTSATSPATPYFYLLNFSTYNNHCSPWARLSNKKLILPRWLFRHDLVQRCKLERMISCFDPATLRCPG